LTNINICRKSIYIESFDGAVIRDVLIFNEPNKLIPDETSSTHWTLTARIFFDSASEEEKGTLSITRVGTEKVTSVPVTLTSLVSNQSQEVTIIIPVNILLLLNSVRCYKALEQR